MGWARSVCLHCDLLLHPKLQCRADAERPLMNDHKPCCHVGHGLLGQWWPELDTHVLHLSHTRCQHPCLPVCVSHACVLLSKTPSSDACECADHHAARLGHPSFAASTFVSCLACHSLLVPCTSDPVQCCPNHVFSRAASAKDQAANEKVEQAAAAHMTGRRMRSGESVSPDTRCVHTFFS